MKVFISILILFAPFLLHSQEFENNHWIFGDGMELDFSTNPPTMNSNNLMTASNVEPAVISDEFGDLLAYSNGAVLVNSAGGIVDNGTFSNTATENIFCPIPGDEDRHYLFRSGAGFVDYSIVDLSAMGGIGYIDPVEKQTEIHPHWSQMLITSHANQIDHWLILVDNNSGSGTEIVINTFLINNTGIVLNSSFINSYTWATWYNSIEEARVSPNCDRIAVSFKGHNIVMFAFDNISGEITDAFQQTVALPDSFIQSQLNYLEFSPSGEYLYVIQDHEMISRFDATLLDPGAFQASGVELPVSTTNNWTHIKRGRDGNLYLMDNDDQIDVLTNADASIISDVLYEDEVIELPSGAEFFPNTFTSCMAPQNIVTQDICQDTVSVFYSTGYEFADSIFWDVDIPNTSDTLFYNDQLELFLTDPGTYEVLFYYLVDTVWYIETDSVIVYEQPSVDLGEDQTLCFGSSVILNAGSGDLDYIWSTAANTNEIEVTGPGAYSVIVTNGACTASDEVIINYLFEPVFELQDSVFCDEVVEFELIATNINSTYYLWNDGSTDPTLTVDSIGQYWVSASNDCFSKTDTSIIEVVKFPDPLVDPYFSVCGNDTLLIQSDHLTGEISWSNGQFGALNYVTGDGVFSLMIHDQGCEKSQSFEVYREPFISIDGLIFPNVISPRNDGLNDIFRPFDPLIPDLDPCLLNSFNNELQIFDRWGLEVNDNSCSFDGTLNGNELVSGTYFFVSNMRSFCMDIDQSKSLQGSFELLRE